jgi:GT2 family glycosyltransferase
MKVAVLIPSRERPGKFLDAVRSVNSTSDADVLAYFDDDDKPYPDVGGAICTTGKRLGSAGAWRKLSEIAMEKEYDIMATLTDDAVMLTRGWDDWVTRVARKKPVCAISSFVNDDDEGANRCDMPAITRGYFEAVGFFIHPGISHYAWPSVVDAMSDGICMVRATKDEFRIRHRQEGALNGAWANDCIVFMQWYAWHKDHGREALAANLGVKMWEAA